VVNISTKSVLIALETKRQPIGAAQPAHAADRCAREIAGILTRFGGALAAADGQSVGPAPSTHYQMRWPVGIGHFTADAFIRSSAATRQHRILCYDRHIRITIDKAMVMNTSTVFIFGTDSDVINICAYALRQSGYAVHILPDLVTLRTNCMIQLPDLVLLQHDGLVQGSETVALYHTLRMEKHTAALPIIIIRCERLEARQQYAREPDPAFAIFPIVFSIEELRATVARLLP